MNIYFKERLKTAMRFAASICVATYSMGALSQDGSSVRDFDIESGRMSDYEIHSELANESINTYNGAVTWSHTDFRIKGNAGFDLSLHRVYNSIQPRQYPRIPTPYGYGWTISYGKVIAPSMNDIDKVCNQSLWNVSTKDNPSLEFADGGRELLVLSSEFSDGSLITTSNWRMICDAGIPIVYSPAGLVIRMGKPYFHPEEPGWLATQITDQFGHLIEIEYGDSAGVVFIDKVTRFSPSGSEEANLDFSYRSEGSTAIELQEVVANTSSGSRRVSYEFEPFADFDLTESIPKKLVRVSRPEGDWNYQYYDKVIDQNENDGIPQAGAGSFSLKSVTYPNGASITYSYQLVQLQPPTRTTREVPYVAGVYQKTVSEPASGQSDTWTYVFEPNSSSVSGINVNTEANVLGPLDVLTVIPPSAEYPKLAYHHYSAYPSGDGRWVAPMLGLLNRTVYFNANDEITAVDQYTHATTRKVSNENYYMPSIDLLTENYYAAHVDKIETFRGVGEFDEAGNKTTSPHYKTVLERDRWGRETKVVQALLSTGLEEVMEITLKDHHIDRSGYITTFNEYFNPSEETDGKWILGGLEYTETAASDFEGNYTASDILSYDASPRYPETGLVKSHVDEGNHWEYTYNAVGEVDTVYSHGDRVEWRRWYKAGVPLAVHYYNSSSTNESSITIQVADDWGDITDTYTPQWHQTKYTYDGIGRVTNIDKPLGADTSIIYSPTEITTTRGELTTIESLNGFGQIIESRVEARGKSIVKNFEYDLLGRKKFESQENSSVGTSYNYDELSRINLETHPTVIFKHEYWNTDLVTFRAVAPSDDSPPNFLTWKFERNAVIGINWGEKILVEKAADWSTGNGTIRTMGYERDLVGRMLRVIPSSLSRGNTSRVIKGTYPTEMPSFTYDDYGRLKTSYTPEEGPRCFQYTKRYVSATYNDTACTSNKLLETTFDLQGRLTWEFDRKELIGKRWTYSGFRLSETKVQYGYTSQGPHNLYEYDANDNLTAETLNLDYVGNSLHTNPSNIESLSHDRFPVNFSYRIEYGRDGLDNIDSVTYPDGTFIEYGTDPFGRATQATPYIPFIDYHTNGLLKQIDYLNGSTKIVTHDDFQRPENLSITNGGSAFIDLTQKYSSLEPGRIASITSRATSGIYDVDSNGKLDYPNQRGEIAAVYFTGEQSSRSVDTNYNYNAVFDNILITNEQEYDDQGRLKFIYQLKGAVKRYPEKVDYYYYSYNDLGHVISRSFSKEYEVDGQRQFWQSEQIFKTSNTGDLLQMLHSETRNTGESVKMLHSYLYGANDWRVAEFESTQFYDPETTWKVATRPKLTTSFYNQAGKLMYSEFIDGCTIQKTSYVYVGNELVAERKTSGYTDYLDLNGNLRDDCFDQQQESSGAGLWNIKSMLSPNYLDSLLAPEHKSLTHSDIKLMPTSLDNAKQASLGLLAILMLIFRAFSSTKINTFHKAAAALLCLLMLALPKSAIAAVTEEITYYHSDLMGNVAAASDEGGNLLYRQRYAPYGKALMRTGQKLGFRQHEYSEETYLIYMGARYMDPLVGRFIGPDPMSLFEAVEGNPRMINRYSFANNNPMNYTDPDGNNPKILLDFALNVSINMLTTGTPNLAGAAVETAKGALNPLATVNKVKKLAIAVQAANRAMKSGGTSRAITKAAPYSKRRPHTRKTTKTNAWDNAEDGSRPNSKTCPDCGGDVFGNPHFGELRNTPNGWDVEHVTKWETIRRGLNSRGASPKEYRDAYNDLNNTILRCRKCNRSDNQL